MTIYILHTEAQLRGPAGPYCEMFAADLHGILRSALHLPPDEPDADGKFSWTLADTEPPSVLSASCGNVAGSSHSCHALLNWHPLSSRPRAPDFDGALSIEPGEGGRGHLHLTGQSRMPSDSTPGATLAATEATVTHVVEELATELERRYARRVPGHPSATPTRYTVADLMQTPPFVLNEGLPLRVAALMMLEQGASGAPVSNAAEEVIGVLTVSDLLAREASPRLRRGPIAREEQRRRLAETVGEACSRPAVITSPAASARAAARELLDKDISLLVVTEDNHIVGTLHRGDLLPALTHTADDLQAAVADILRELGADEVHATVTGAGHIFLGGTISLRSSIDRLISAASALDGITEIRTEYLRWAHDDLASTKTDA